MTSATDDLDACKVRGDVRLSCQGQDDLVARSQARRVLAGLDRFREISLDFTGIDTIGPAFADEIFRVHARQRPEVHLIPVHAAEDVARMIRRAVLRSQG